ncbi:hypothetical protein B0A48_10909 [Cryoendolithus antarcticus]|uniref:Zn(2)-C6 fungal-type domain-containing protein n=1 Tax=Cryoendolithus antarcticus TaxID=1507870 RepID=A0A1V8SZB1_9PEZI|nr:hypothetical protein B0A48_10909 [Cryoendolithus antarcticus]
MQTSNCDRCYRRKGRCDKGQPCFGCQQAGVQCSYTDKTRQRRYTADEFDRVEKRLRQLEARNRGLEQELSVAKAARAEQDGISPAETHRSGESTQSKRVDAVSQVSYLSITAAGERQPYLGSTSGVLFADLVRSGVDASVSRVATPRPGSPSCETSGQPQNLVQLDRNLQDLPSYAVAKKLTSAYFEHDAISFPFLVPSGLLEVSERFYEDETHFVSKAHSYDVFIFNMVLAIATASVYKYDWHMLPSAESHHARAMQELNAVLACGGLKSLQAILLLCQYRQGSSIKDNSASMWHLVGIAARICLELGLHRETAYPLKWANDMTGDQLERFVDQEVARRCFWCLIAMDRVTSNILGRPLAIHDDDIDTLLPSVDSSAVFDPPSNSTAIGNRAAVFNAIIQYRLICGRTLTVLHRPRSMQTCLQDALRTRDGLAQKLHDWLVDVKRIGLAVDLTSPTTERSCFLSETWYELLYANAKLMIWRPCPLLVDLLHDQVSLQNIYDASVQSITVYALLHKSRKINYSWITLQSAFLAGLSYVYSISRHLRAKRNTSASEPCLLSLEPTTLEIVNVSRVNLTVDDEFLHCYDNLQTLYDHQQIEDPVMHLSQDWLGYLGNYEGSYMQGTQYGASSGVYGT